MMDTIEKYAHVYHEWGWYEESLKYAPGRVCVVKSQCD